MEAALFGSAATAGTATTAATAATSGLFGVGGSFALGQTAMTLGLGLSTVGMASSSADKAAALDYNAEVNRRNAEITDRQTERDIIELEKAKRRDEKQLRQQQQRRAGMMRAQMGASGVELSGSAEQVLSGQSYWDELDAQILIGDYEAQKKNRVYGGAAQASNYNAQAGLDSFSSKSTSGSIAGNSVGKILSGGGSIYGKRVIS